MTNNFSVSKNFDHKGEREKNSLLAIFLGLLTFAVTPFVALFFSLPFLIPGLIPESYNPIIIINSITGFTEATGYFAAQFIFIGLLALLGDFITGVISLFINNRSKKSAFITFVSAFVFQVLFLAIVIPVTAKVSNKIMETGIEHERAYQKFAKIGKATFKTEGQFTATEVKNPHPEYGPLYKKLQILIPVSVLHKGSYQINVRYSFPENGNISTPLKTTTGYFDAGEHTMLVEFLYNEISSYGYWSPDSAKGFANIELSYISTNSSNKFVERKQIKF